MDMRWSLKELYPSFESLEFKNDLEKCDGYISKIYLWTNENTTNSDNVLNKLEEYINMQNELSHLIERLGAYCHLTLSVDTKHETALKYMEKLESKLTGLAEPAAKFKKWLGSIENLTNVIESSSLLKEHDFFLNEIKLKSKYALSDKEEVVVAKMKNTGSNAWLKLKDLLVSNLLVLINIDGEDKKLPLTVIRNMAHEKDAELRKKAYEAELKSYENIDDSVAACLNGIKGEVITLNKLRGYSSPLEETLINSRMDFESLNAMLTAMKESMPAFRRFYRRKAELLGNKNGLPFYDLFAPLGEVNMKFTYEQARDFIVSNFRTFSDNLADYALNAFNSSWIDAEPRVGKRGGAFCSNLHTIGESRIMSNFSGSFSDVVTLAHELGHGYHGSCLTNETALNSDYPMPIAETASTFCETIVKKAAIENASKEEAFSILESELSDSGQVIVDIYSRYLFETELFRRRESSSLTTTELKEIMINSQKEAYGDGLDENYLHPYMWVCKPHYYYAETNFYNFPYAFGLLFAKGLYAAYLKNGSEFVKAYDDLLSLTGKNKLADITKLMGIDINSVDFWRSSLKLIEDDIEKFISLSK